MLKTLFAAAACAVLACSVLACGQVDAPQVDAARSSQDESNAESTLTTAKCQRRECTRTEERCVAGCDPPNEKGTITGCSSCYSRRSVCVAWRTAPC